MPNAKLSKSAMRLDPGRPLRSIEMKLATAAAVMVVLIGCTALGFYRETRAFMVDLDRQEQTHARLSELQALLTAVQVAELGVEGFVITGSESHLAFFGNGGEEAIERLRALYESEPDSGRIPRLASGVNAKLAELARIAQARRDGGIEAARRMMEEGRGDRISEQLRTDVVDMLETERASLGLHRARTHERLARVVIIWLMLTAASVGGATIAFVEVIKQVKRNRLLRRRLEHDAHHDFLTGLPNRAYFQQTLDHTIARAERDHTRSALLYMDLNGFKAVNDQFGHDAGDLVLIEVAHRLRQVARSADFLARLGGDEFAVILPHYERESQIEDLAARLCAEVSTMGLPALGGLPVSVSIGVATYPDDGADAQTLLNAADEAMFSDKRTGTDR